MKLHLDSENGGVLTLVDNHPQLRIVLEDHHGSEYWSDLSELSVLKLIEFLEENYDKRTTY